MSEGFIPPHGGYQSLLSYQRALVVYDATVYFCGRFFNKRDRTCDQMIQAARSGKQNIVEGSQISGTSKESEIKLTNVARGSLEELLEDYRDFLRPRKIDEWPKNHKFVKRLQSLNRQPGANYETFRKGIEHPDPAICANVIIGLIKVTVGYAESLNRFTSPITTSTSRSFKLAGDRINETRSPRGAQIAALVSPHSARTGTPPAAARCVMPES